MKKAKCFKCKRNLTYHQSFAGSGEFVREKRDIDGLDIFSCGYFICHAEFKIDTDLARPVAFKLLFENSYFKCLIGSSFDLSP